MSTMQFDVTAAIAGAGAWAVAIPVVKFVGDLIAKNDDATTKTLGLAAGLGISIATTPLLAKILGWRNREEKVRGIAIALGVAQALDGIVHVCWPAFYSADKNSAIAAAGNIFWGAGTLGILSAYA